MWLADSADDADLYTSYIPFSNNFLRNLRNLREIVIIRGDNVFSQTVQMAHIFLGTPYEFINLREI